MGIVSFSNCFSRAPVLSVLLTPLQALMGLFVPTGDVLTTTIKRSRPHRLDIGSGMHACQTIEKDACVVSRAKSPLKQSPRRLKIVREFEPGVGASCAGRMTISGRMADVCAELDRMAQREAATCPH